MKYATTTHVIFFASIATSTLRTGFAVPRPASKFVVPHQQQRQRKSEESSQSSPPGLLVDKEGNLYSPHRVVTKRRNAQQRSCKEVQTLAVCQSLRGGNVCVDNEGNFYTPKTEDRTKIEIETDSFMPSATATTATTATALRDINTAQSTSSTLRGGSHSHNIGGLGVDSEGNLFATHQEPAAAATLRLRGGDLSVDQEGNLYTPRRHVPPPVGATLAGNRRLQSSGSSHDAILLTKNRLSKKTTSAGSGSTGTKSKKPFAAVGEDPMAFIGYNNALMET